MTTLEKFMRTHFPDLWGTTDTRKDAIDVWNYDGDRLLFSLTDDGSGDYSLLTWHKNNKDLKNERHYIQPTEKELLLGIRRVLANEGQLVGVWARVGMSGYLTNEQLDMIKNERVTESDMLEWIKAGIFVLDGETYFPDEVVLPPEHTLLF